MSRPLPNNEVGGESPPLRYIRFESVSDVAEDTVLRYMAENAARELPWIPTGDEGLSSVVICGGGPSLRDELPRLKALVVRGHPVWAANGVHDYLINHGIVPDAMVMMDSNQRNVSFVRHPHDDVAYYIASRCHPDVFDALEGQNISVWHAMLDDERDHAIVATRGGTLVNGGNTVGLRSMYLAYLMGAREFHLFGFDSSLSSSGEAHAYEQESGAAEWAVVGGVSFRSTPSMMAQVQYFQEQLHVMADCEINVYGEGLLQHVVELRNGYALGN